MSGVALARRRWAPGPSAQVDKSHPLASGLNILDWFPSGHSRYGAAATTPGTARAPRPGPFGTALGRAVSYPSRLTTTPGGWSIAIAGVMLAGGGTYLTFMLDGAGGGNSTFYGNGTDLMFYTAMSVTQPITVAAGIQDVPFVASVACSLSGVTVRCNGVATNYTGTGAGAYGTALQTVTAGGQPASDRNCALNLFATWTRKLSPGEQAMLDADPFCMLRGA